MPQSLALWIPLLLIVLFMFWGNRWTKKQQQRVEDERHGALVVGNHVMTGSGFFGTIVDIDGDAVTLQSPSGDETVWLASAIARVADIPVAPVPEDREDADSEDLDIGESRSFDEASESDDTSEAASEDVHGTDSARDDEAEGTNNPGQD
ncbi:MAG: preprotein translocase subunit YajC [Actinomycetaceae bacterium]|nr:preprotein translocase subunit YajC [Actinomycetaceae bacterium]MDY6083264.1 preprotein translocase subunit YajC [Actinomycetaceae bacterium]